MIKKLPKSQVEFEISIPWEKWEKYLGKAASEISEEIKIPGFRPGKAPKKMVEQKVGIGALLNNAAEKAVEKSYVDFIVAEKLEVLGNPEIKVEELTEGKDLLFKARVAVMPEAKIKDGYKKEIKKINEECGKKTVEIKDEELALELEKLANSRVKLVTVNREAEKNNSVEVDFSVLIGGVPIENGTSKNHPLIIGREVFIPGFEANLIGMKAGEEKEFELEFPKDYHKKDLAGKLAIFKVAMKLVQERQTPEINDDFAKSLGEFENLEALKKNIREGMEHEAKHKNEDEKKAKYVEAIISNTETDLPEVMVKKEVEQMLNEFEYQVQSMGMNLDQYLEKIKKDKKELEKDWESQAEKRVKSALALKEIAKLEEIKIEAPEIEAEMNKTLSYYKNVKDIEKNIDMERLYNYTKGILENDAVFKILEKI